MYEVNASAKMNDQKEEHIKIAEEFAGIIIEKFGVSYQNEILKVINCTVREKRLKQIALAQEELKVLNDSIQQLNTLKEIFN